MIFRALLAFCVVGCASGPLKAEYPAHWWEVINDPNKPSWEILPHEAGPGEVILSKRNELGILSNFAPTAFKLYGKRYASVEGYWQMMKFPEGPNDPRSKIPGADWSIAREEVGQMIGHDAKRAGDVASKNLKLGKIDWVSFEGERFPYRAQTPGRHYELILAAMCAKIEQNAEVKRILLLTGDLKLRPDHAQSPNDPPEWRYFDIWMQIRSALQGKSPDICR